MSENFFKKMSATPIGIPSRIMRKDREMKDRERAQRKDILLF